MNIERTTDNELADLAANVLTLLGGTELASIDTNIRADLVTAIGTRATDLAVQTAEAAIRDGEKKAAFSVKDMTRTEVVHWARRVRATLRAVRAPKTEYDLCGFDYPLPRVTAYIAEAPTNMSAVGFSNGVNSVRFDGNNKPGQVVYEIWRREGDSSGWYRHALTKKQTYEDTGVTPGQYYEYRVRAVAAKNVSNFSNSAVVYGVL